ncbi:hypothetical protein GCM10010172_50170 [Paractinoplanes ferrugineus]|uniref:Uncharacterized protein n=1 Tax=Paractinoplanes ferrugineus TaxID=113564 RepID=A0A919MDE8_9ACTN|nr:hypothetical protein [Actinoplanes ferrugineus]GIE15721.1 hypothetical protein Afe05nite_75610 [Actinoplanes ferrugineus]
MWADRRGGAGPTPEEIERWQRRTSAPDNELPGAAGVLLLLGHTDDAAVAVTQVEGFSTGWRFTLAVRLRRPRPGPHLHMLLSRRAHLGLEIPVQDRLLLGLEYPDGRRASTLRDEPMGRPDDGAELVFRQQSGSGDDRSHDQSYWVSPLPPPGPVTFVLAWPSAGLPETRTGVDGAAIRAAAGQARELWAPQPPEEHLEPPAPARPADGWFAEES